MRFRLQCAIAVVLGGAGIPAAALGPDQVFERAAPSVWSLRALNAADTPIGFGSAVVIGPGRVVTACSVLARARSIELRRGNQVYSARLEHPDVERNLCELDAQGLDSPAVALAPPGAAKVGQPAYLVSVPQKLATTLGAGMIAGLGSEQAGVPPVQSTIVVGPGSAGGGLFDADARLLGIAMPQPAGRDKPAAALGFAAPAHWIGDIPQRATAALARRRDSPALQAGAAAGSLPAIGATWKYDYVDRKYSMRIPFTLRVTGVEDGKVHEALEVDGTAATQNASITALAPGFVQRPLNAGRALFEFAPYLLAAGGGESSLSASAPKGYPLGGYSGTDWSIATDLQERAPIGVPAGSFNAHKLVVTGRRAGLPGNFASTGALAGRFSISVWYAAEARRYVMLQHQTWSMRGLLLSDETIELREFRN